MLILTTGWDVHRPPPLWGFFPNTTDLFCLTSIREVIKKKVLNLGLCSKNHNKQLRRPMETHHEDFSKVENSAKPNNSEEWGGVGIGWDRMEGGKDST